MSKLPITKEIEKAILNWAPAKIGDIKVNQMRTQHTALEVPVECGTNLSGLVDAVKVSEYFSHVISQPFCRLASWQLEGIAKDFSCPNNHELKPKKFMPCNEKGCRFNYIAESGEPDILITCFEIKVSKADFKSKHGHNFVGNMNFYCVPEELYPEIKDMVPDGIGVLIYHHLKSYVGLRTKVKPTFMPMTDAEQKWMMLSVLKRMRDMEKAMYDERLKDMRFSFEHPKSIWD